MTSNAFPSNAILIKQRLGRTAASNLYWSCRENRNFGDWIGPFLFEELTGRQPVYCTARHRSIKSVYFTAGSIFQHIKAHGVASVWGSGIMKRDARFRRPKMIHAVRGPVTRQRCEELGFDCPEVYGDPGILLPHFLPYKEATKFAVGVVPHFVDYDDAVRHFAHHPTVRIINVLNDMPEVVQQIAECNAIVSSSLHGIIIANAYGRPALRAIFSNRIVGDGVKYVDYAQSISSDYKLECIKITDGDDATAAIDKLSSLDRPPDLTQLQKTLIAACPFSEDDRVPPTLRQQ